VEPPAAAAAVGGRHDARDRRRHRHRHVAAQIVERVEGGVDLLCQHDGRGREPE
jgi:hypothetical protein